MLVKPINKGKNKALNIICRVPIMTSRARRIRTFKMTESESAALPFGYSPIIYVNDISVGYEL